jgi:hypothetical protein
MGRDLTLTDRAAVFCKQRWRQFAAWVDEILSWQCRHFVNIVFRGEALGGGVGAGGEIDSVSHAL